MADETSTIVTLLVRQGAHLQRGFQLLTGGVAQPLDGYEFKSQARTKEDPSSPLIIDLTPYLSIDAGDSTILWLEVPAQATSAIVARTVRETANWDLFYWPAGHPEDAELMVQGPFELDASATDMRA